MQGYGNFIVQSRDTGCYGWAALSYRTLFDDEGHPLKAVGILENLPHSFAGEKDGSILNRPLPRSVTSDLILTMSSDLSQDYVKELWMDGRDLSDQIQGERCSRILFQEETRLSFWDSGDEQNESFDRQSLLQRFSLEEHWLSAEYRRASDRGDTEWVFHAACLAEDPLTGKIYLFTYILRLDRRRRLEQNLQSDIVRDPVTRLYDRNTVRALAESLIASGGGMCAMALIEVSGLARLYAGDMENMNRKRYCIAAALTVSLGTSCIIGQYSNDSDPALLFGCLLKIRYPEADRGFLFLSPAVTECR